MRRKNAAVIMATQQISDIANSEIADVVLENWDEASLAAVAGDAEAPADAALGRAPAVGRRRGRAPPRGSGLTIWSSD